MDRAIEFGIGRMQGAVLASAKREGKIAVFLRSLSGLPLPQQLKAVADELATISDPAERVAFALEIFGRDGADMLSWLAHHDPEQCTYPPALF